MDFDDFAGDYDQLVRENLRRYGEDTAYYVEYKPVMMKRCAVNTAPSSILDFGCGMGRSLPFLHQIFPQSAIWGCDPSRNSLKEAQRRNPQCSFFLVDEEPPQRFDLILVSCVFHHIPPENRDTVMGKLQLLMNPGAELFVFEHNPYNPLTRHAVNTCPFDQDAVLLPARTMARLIARSGLTVVAKKYTLFFPSSLRRLCFLEPFLSALPLGGQYMIHARRNIGYEESVGK